MANLMYEAGKQVAKSDDETLFRLIIDLSGSSPFAGALLGIGEAEGWTVQRTALVLTYALLVREDEYMQRLAEMAASSSRPIIMNRHCAKCLCEDKSTTFEDSPGKMPGGS
jgi:hypothetical protein